MPVFSCGNGWTVHNVSAGYEGRKDTGQTVQFWRFHHECNNRCFLFTSLYFAATESFRLNGLPVFCGDRMYVELITENRKEVLEELQSQEQKRFMKQMKNSLEIFRTEYVYALLQERNPEKAAEILAQFEKAGKMYPYESSLCSERELIQIAEKLG